MPRTARLKIHNEPTLYFLGSDLVRARERLGLSQEEFAKKCGWTQQYQSKLELPDIRHYLTSYKQQQFSQAGLVIELLHKKG